MPSTGRRDLVANRWEPFVHTVAFEGFDYSAATFAMQVRLTPDAAGSPLVSLATVGSIGTEGITITGTTVAGGITTTNISVRINEATMAALPLPAERGATMLLAWDMQITPSGGGTKFRVLEGAFTVSPGVTH